MLKVAEELCRELYHSDVHPRVDERTVITETLAITKDEIKKALKV